MSKGKVLVTGITGQDGSNLADLLVNLDYEVFGIVRRASTINTSRIDHLLFPVEKVKLLYGDLCNGIDGILYDIKPNLIFNTAGMSYVACSFNIPISTLDINTLGPVRILDAIYRLGFKEKIRYLQCSSSEMFGMSPPPQNENTPFLPRSPYGISKLGAYWATRTYRDAYKIFSCNSICFNHAGPRRGETFVSKKIVRAAVRIKLGKQDKLELGLITSKRDWGDSRDYIQAMFKIITADVPDDFVVATGFQHTIQEFVERVFEKLNLDHNKYVKISASNFRPLEVPDLLGDSSKIRRVLGWEPKISFDQMIDDMIAGVMQEEQSGNKVQQ